VCGLAGQAAAADGIQIVQKVTTGPTVQTFQIQMDNSHMRAEIADAAGKKQVILFDGARQAVDIVDVDRKTYVEMTKADVERIATQMQGALAMMQQQMANLPPAQRAQMEAMMRGRGMPGAAPVAKTEYKRNGTDHVGRWTCDKYDGYQNGEKTSELCTVSPTALGLGMTDLDVSRQLAEFYSKLVPQQAEQIVSVGRMEDQGFSGFPVRRIFKIGQNEATMEVTQAGRANIPASQFTVPAGFTKTEMPGISGVGARGGRGR
jgi:hypothetical protein